MNDRPQVEVVETDGKNINNGIGKELSVAHKLLCKLRAAGSDYRDLLKLVDCQDSVFDRIFASARGLIAQEPFALKCGEQLVNLSREPVLREIGNYNDSCSLITDSRLGIWVAQSCGAGLIVGDRRVVVTRPQGRCVVNISKDNHNGPGSYVLTRYNLMPGRNEELVDDVIDLNCAAAKWLNPKVDIQKAAGLFAGLPGNIPTDGSKFPERKIFFLGTIWKVYNTCASDFRPTLYESIQAPALIADTENRISLKAMHIPVGEWPNDCYIAVLKY